MSDYVRPSKHPYIGTCGKQFHDSHGKRYHCVFTNWTNLWIAHKHIFIETNGTKIFEGKQPLLNRFLSYFTSDTSNLLKQKVEQNKVKE